MVSRTAREDGGDQLTDMDRPARRRPFTAADRALFVKLWAVPGFTERDIATTLGRSRGSVAWLRHDMALPPRPKTFFSFCGFASNTASDSIFLISPGLRRLLLRSYTLIEWVGDGRDNYELSRAFHVPMADVIKSVAILGLVRPYEAEAPVFEPTKRRQCSACGQAFQATKYRFRCDACLKGHERVIDHQYNAWGF